MRLRTKRANRHTEMKSSSVLLGVLVVAALLACTEGVILTVPGNSRECLREDIAQGQNVKVLFQVLDGGDLSLDFEIDDPEGGRVHYSETLSDGRMDFRAAKSGFFLFCFNNAHSSADKQLSVDVVVGDSVDTGFAPNPDVLTPAEEQVVSLSQIIQDVKYDQEYIHLRDIAHQNSLCYFSSFALMYAACVFTVLFDLFFVQITVASNTNKRVMFWFFFQITLIIVLGVWQVLFVTRFFEVKRIV